MRATAILRLSGLLLVAAAPAAADPLAELEAQQQALSSAWRPRSSSSPTIEGSAPVFFVDEHGLVLTSAHVVASRRR
jgi:hypothetical protein